MPQNMREEDYRRQGFKTKDKKVISIHKVLDAITKFLSSDKVGLLVTWFMNHMTKRQ